ncbi:MAG: RNA polymerase sporulation sigma factor SigK [Clostridia bacterium]|nr:RNA polymerase sporulation sigma factor SigK [Clostridia bacterium]
MRKGGLYLLFIAIIKYIIENILFMFGFIGGSGNAFPKPLTPSEEKMYFELYKNGDNDAKNVLIERNLRLVVHIAKKYSVSWKDNDDLISIGTIGLIKAVTTFDYMKGHKFATYAARCIQNEILMHLRSSKKLQNEISLDEPIGSDKEGNSISLIDILESDAKETFEEVNLKLNTNALYNDIENVLTDREKLIIALRYGLTDKGEKTQNEIAKMLNISRSYVSRIEKKAIEKIAGNMNKLK